MRSRQLTTLALASIAVTMSGCGGSGTSQPLTRAELISKADAICGRINNEISTHSYSSPQAIARLAPAIAAFERAAVTEMRALEAPASLAVDWRQIVADAHTVAVGTARLGEYAKAGKVTALPTLIKVYAPAYTQMLALAKRDGFAQCSQPG